MAAARNWGVTGSVPRGRGWLLRPLGTVSELLPRLPSRLLQLPQVQMAIGVSVAASDSREVPGASGGGFRRRLGAAYRRMSRLSRPEAPVNHFVCHPPKEPLGGWGTVRFWCHCVRLDGDHWWRSACYWLPSPPVYWCQQALVVERLWPRGSLALVDCWCMRFATTPRRGPAEALRGSVAASHSPEHCPQVLPCPVRNLVSGSGWPVDIHGSNIVRPYGNLPGICELRRAPVGGRTPRWRQAAPLFS